MKTGIITFQNANNYGAVLQAFALQKTMEKLGHKVSIINYDSPNMGLKSDQLDSFKGFTAEYLNLTEEYDEIDDIDVKGYDLLITGSDQVWNPSLTRSDSAYFLGFASSYTKTASYAASIGIEGDELEGYRDFFKTNLIKIDHVSVRESAQKEFLQSIIDEEIAVNLDPTLLLEAEEYSNHLNISRKNGNHIFMYSNNTDAKILDFVNLLSLQTGMEIIAVTRMDEMLFVDGSKVFKYVSPIIWLNALASAAIVITDSFHGFMFSLIFEKPFYIYTKNRKNITRITEVMKKCHLFDRRLTIIPSVGEVNYDIDFSYARKFIESGKSEAIMYLNNLS